MDDKNNNNTLCDTFTINNSVFWFLVLAFFSLFYPKISLANPQGGTVINGNAAISNLPNQTIIKQSTDKAIINWQSFNIGANETTQFIQPSTSSITLNRVYAGNGTSQIYGKLTANGNVWIINPAGIVFGKGAQVNVGGLLATTADISNEDFIQGKYRFKQSDKHSGSVINNGNITATEGGLVALIAPGVENNGVIEANCGKVILASGKTYTLDLYGDDLIHFGIDSEIQQPGKDSTGKNLNTAVSNSGKIIAHAGKVLVTVRAAKNIVERSINMSGIIEAKSVSQKNGQIILSGGDNGVVNVTGKLIASGKEKGQKGGNIKVLGEQVALQDDAELDASGDQKGGAILVGGDQQGKNPAIQNAKDVYVGSNVKINADALTDGDGGKVIVWANENNNYFGSVSARGGSVSGNGGFVEISGKESLDYQGTVDTQAPFGNIGTLLLDPKNIVISTAGVAYKPTNPGQNNLFTNNVGATTTITPISLNAAATNILLQANNDITFTDAVNLTTLNASLTATAGRNINVNNNITTNNGAITLVANAHAPDFNPVTTDRSSGAASLTMASGTTLNSTGGVINLSVQQTSGTFTAGNITLRTITSGGGSITVDSPNTLTLNNAINSGTGNVILNANSDGAGAQNFTMATGSSITTNGSAITINVNNTAGGTGTATLQNISTSGGTFSVATNAGGNTTGGAITQGAGTTVTVGDANLSTGNGAITLNNVGNDFTGAVALTTTGANNVTIRDNNDILLATSSLGQNLTINANGTIAQKTGSTITAPGTTTLVAGGNDITLDKNNNFGTVSITSGNNVSLKNSGALNFASSTISGNLIVDAGPITQTAALNVTGTSNFRVGANSINLSNSGNNFVGAVSLNNTGANAVSLRDTNTLDLGTVNVGGPLTIQSNGALTQSGVITANNTSSFNAGAGAITLTNTANHFSDAVSLTNTGANDIHLINNANLILGTVSMANAAGNLMLETTSASNGSITQSGATTITTGTGNVTLNAGSAPITLTNNNDFRSTGVNGVSLNNSGANDVSINDINALQLTTSTIGQNITATAGGAITQIAGSTLSANDITYSTPNAININGHLIGTGSVTMNANNDGSGAQSFVMGAGSSITTNGTPVNINVNTATGGTGGATLRDIIAGTGAIIVSTNTTTGGTLNQITGTTLSGGNINLTSANAVTLNGLTSASGSVTINANADGAGNQGFTMGTGSSITTAGTPVLIRVNAATGGTGVATLRNIVTSGGALTVTTNTGGNLTGGAISQASGTTINVGAANLSTGNGNITLNNSGNDFSGVVTVNTTGAANGVTLRDDNDITFGASSVGQNLVVNANGTIDQISALTVNGTSTFNAGIGDIILTNSNNNLVGTISLNANASTYLINANNIVLGTSTIGQDVHVRSTRGSISQVGGGLNVGGTLITDSITGTILNGNNKVTGFDAGNTLTGNIELKNTANMLTLSNIDQTSGGDVMIQNTGSIDTTCNIKTTTNGNITLTATDNLSLNAPLSAESGNIVLTGSNGIHLNTIIASNTGDVTFNNPVTLEGSSSVAGNNITFAAKINGPYALAINNNGLFSINHNINVGKFQQIGSGTVYLNADITATQGITFNSPINLSSSAVLTTNNSDINFNGTINGNQNLTLDAGSLGSIYFNAEVGNLTRLGKLTIVNAYDVTNNSTIQLDSFLQQAGTHVTSLGAHSLDVTGSSSITTYNVMGTINTGSLNLNTAYANLHGSIAGLTGQAGANKIVLLNNIGPGTHYFDDINLYKADSAALSLPTINPMAIFPAYLFFDGENYYQFCERYPFRNSPYCKRNCFDLALEQG